MIGSIHDVARRGSSMLFAIALLGCDSSPETPEPPASRHVLRVVPALDRVLFPNLHEGETPETSTNSVFLGRDERGRDIRATSGIRYAVAGDRIEVAARAFEAPVEGAARLDGGAWLFMLEDATLWRAPGPLAAPTFVARAEVESDFRAFPGQRSALAFRADGRGYVTSGSWPPREVQGLPEHAIEDLLARGERLVGHLTGGGRVVSEDGGESFTYGSTVDEAAEPPAHPDASVGALREALIVTYPAIAEVLAHPLPDGGSFWAQGRDLYLAREGRVERIADALPAPESRVLGYHRTIVVATREAPDDAVLLSSDGRSFRRAAAEGGSYYPNEMGALLRSGGCGGDRRAYCALAQDGTLHRVGAAMEREVLNASFALARRPTEVDVCRVGADGSLSEPVRTFPRRGTRFIPTPDESILVVVNRRSVWTPERGAVRLPRGVHDIGVMDARRWVIIGADLRSIRVTEDAGRTWAHVVPDAPDLPNLLLDNMVCSPARCRMGDARQGREAIVIERGEARSVDDPVARAPSGHAPPSRGRSGPYRPVVSNIRLSCTAEPVAAPQATVHATITPRGITVPRSSRRVTTEMPSEIDEVLVLGDVILWAGSSSPTESGLFVADPSRAVERIGAAGVVDVVARAGGGSLLLSIGAEGASWYELDPSGAVARRGGLTRVLGALGGGFGWLGNEQGWSALVPSTRDELAMAIELDGRTMPAPARVPREPPICTTPTPSARTMRIPVEVWDDSLGAVATGTMVLDTDGTNATCIRALEGSHARARLRLGDVESVDWVDPGRLELDGDRLSGVIQDHEGRWKRVTCTSPPP